MPDIPKPGDKVQVDGKDGTILNVLGVNAIVQMADGKTVHVPLAKINKGE